MKKPVLLLNYNRPELTKRLVRSVLEYGPSKVYLACDGPSSGRSADKELVGKVREVLIGAPWKCPVEHRFLEKNVGLRDAVIGAIDWFFESEEEGIILEDDCIPNREFFDFMHLVLDRYKSQKEVFGVTGSNYARVQFPNRAAFGFVRIAIVWGWATWRDRWASFDRNLSLYRGSAWQRDRFPWPSSELFYALRWHLEQMVGKEPKSWGYHLAWTVIVTNSLWVVPSSNMVSNVGFSRDATHTKGRIIGQQGYKTEDSRYYPETLSVDLIAENKILAQSHRVYHPLWLNSLRDLIRGARSFRHSVTQVLRGTH